MSPFFRLRNRILNASIRSLSKYRCRRRRGFFHRAPFFRMNAVRKQETTFILRYLSGKQSASLGDFLKSISRGDQMARKHEIEVRSSVAQANFLGYLGRPILNSATVTAPTARRSSTRKKYGLCYYLLATSKGKKIFLRYRS